MTRVVQHWNICQHIYNLNICLMLRFNASRSIRIYWYIYLMFMLLRAKATLDTGRTLRKSQV